MGDEKRCFVIMPISTPAMMVDKYHDGKDHFHHVYYCLFAPSIIGAGYTPIPPKADGSEMIHPRIIGNLESSDLVLCDMSCLNPNVFFEWGIRTALNKPVCIVKDEFATYVPFDIGVLNYQEYKSTLPVWEIEAEREKLISHLTASAGKAGDGNALWKFFGLSSKVRPYQVQEGADGKLEYLAMQVDSISKRIDTIAERRPAGSDAKDMVQSPPSDRVSPITKRRIQNALLAALPVEARSFCVDMHEDSMLAPGVSITTDDTWTDDTLSAAERIIQGAFELPVSWKRGIVEQFQTQAARVRPIRIGPRDRGGR